MTGKKRIFRLISALPLLVTCSLGAQSLLAAEAGDPALENLNQLVSENRFADAYEAAQALLGEFEGDPEFDFLYGISALETGRPNEAVFAFERIAVLFPQQQRVKLELARSFYQANNLPAARELFNEVLASNPSENVQANIRAFIEAIDERESQLDGSFSWYVNSNIGNDSNINSATELGVISTPIGDVELSANGQSIDDSFMDIGGGVAYVKPTSKTSSINVNGTYSRHNNFASNDFDIDVFSVDANYSHMISNMRLSYGGRAQKVNLNSDSFQNSASLLATMQRSPGNGWTQTMTGAYTAVRYDTGINANADLRDVNQLLVSGVLGKSVGNFYHSVSVYYGDEQAQKDLGRNNAQQFYGIAFYEQFQLVPGHLPYFRISLHKSDYKSEAPIFNVKRQDDTFSTSLGWIWNASRNINVTTDITYTENESNIDLFAYDRVKYQTGLRYQF
jgi:tetratricopeptide (TPR) repeat protein